MDHASVVGSADLGSGIINAAEGRGVIDSSSCSFWVNDFEKTIFENSCRELDVKFMLSCQLNLGTAVFTSAVMMKVTSVGHMGQIIERLEGNDQYIIDGEHLVRLMLNFLLKNSAKVVVYPGKRSVFFDKRVLLKKDFAKFISFRDIAEFEVYFSFLMALCLQSANSNELYDQKMQVFKICKNKVLSDHGFRLLILLYSDLTEYGKGEILSCKFDDVVLDFIQKVPPLSDQGLRINLKQMC